MMKRDPTLKIKGCIVLVLLAWLTACNGTSTNNTGASDGTDPGSGDDVPDVGTGTDTPDEGSSAEDVPDEGSDPTDEGEDGQQEDVPDEGGEPDIPSKDVPDEGCVPVCDGKACGDDGCGGTCGSCEGCDGPDESLCNAEGTCDSACCPSCPIGAECGDDGCGGSCGTCPADSTCSDSKCLDSCATAPTCTCVLESCGLTSAFFPIEGLCETLADAGKVAGCFDTLLAAYTSPSACGDDCAKANIPGLASLCETPECEQMLLILSDYAELPGKACELCFCEPSCTGKSCGGDGCGGSCGECSFDEYCDPEGACVSDPCLELVTSCPGKLPPDLICSVLPAECIAFFNAEYEATASCGSCEVFPLPGIEEACKLDVCAEALASAPGFLDVPVCAVCNCEPSCLGKECGADGCGGSCGECGEGLYCNGASCIEDGDMLCLDMAICQLDCETDLVCQEECKVDAMFAELPKITAYEKCVASCPADAEEPAASCLSGISSCFSDYYACLTLTTGDLGCFETYYCLSTCGSDPACDGSCFDGATGAGMSKMAMKVHGCVEGVCGPDYDAVCAESALAGDCADIWAACNGDGACTNEADQTVIGSEEFGAVMVPNCGLGCLGAPAGCTSACLIDMSGLSEGCAECYDPFFTCFLDHCLEVCLTGDAGCDSCLETNGCSPDFFACAGTDPGAIFDIFLPPPPPPAP